MSKVLITGGGGYLGYKLARRILSDSDDEVVLWLRAREARELDARRAVCDQLFAQHRNRVTYAWGDLAMPDPFASVDRNGLCAIYHPAADTRFNIDADAARTVNIEGTQKLLAFARTCKTLDAVALVSTVYSSGLRGGPIDEQLHGNEAGFANHYEHSKWASERAVDEYADLPWKVFRTATILADDETGSVLQYNIAHKVKRLMWAGLLPIFPGRAEMPIYFVTGDFVADTIAALGRRAPAQRVYNVCHTADESLTLGRWLELAYDAFMQEEAFVSRRFMRPIMTDLPTFRVLAASVQTFSRDAVMQAVVKLVNPFAEQMFVIKHLRNPLVRELTGGYRAPDPAELLVRVCSHLAATDWGARPVGSGAPVRRWEC